MGHEEYWLAISRDGILLGGGFFVTRSYALTSAACVRDLRPGASVDLHTAGGLPLPGRVFEVAEDMGVALIGVAPDPLVDYATPQADHVVKGDSWCAPYRPSPVAAVLTGTVDAVTDGRRDAGGRPVGVIDLTPDRDVPDHRPYAGGPVERRAEGRDTAVVGVLLDPDHACRLRGTANDSPAAGAIGSVVAAFRELSPENLLGLLGPNAEGRDEAARAERPAGGPGPRASAGAAAPGAAPPSGAPPVASVGGAPRPSGDVRGALDTAWLILREFKQMADESLVDPRDLPPFQIRVLDEVVREAWGEEAP
jgi:hypothetical protein